MAPEAQDSVLAEIEKSDPHFFSLVQQHTIQGTFCDPYYGGNAGYVGWDLLSYPGIRMAVSEQDEAMGGVDEDQELREQIRDENDHARDYGRRRS